MKKNILLILFIVVSIHTATAQYQGVYSLRDTTGTYPFGSLVYDGTYLYGMTYDGGASNMGTIIKVKPNGTGFAKLHNFSGSPADGSNPYGSLIIVGTYLYGMTTSGGASSTGIIFKIKPDGTSFTIVHEFNGTYGCCPKGSLIYDGTYLYGMTMGGGAHSAGSVFKIKPDGTSYANLHDFEGSADGSCPWGDLTLVGNYLYGIATSDNLGSGTIFKIKPDGTGYSVIYTFVTATGYNPHGSLVSDGTYLYGICHFGGLSPSCSWGCGTIFRIKTDGTGFACLQVFDASNGYWPEGSLTFEGSFLYGMTWNGGGANGTIFRIMPDGTDFTTLYAFDYAANPFGSLISDGTYLYGMTHMGGVQNVGTVFKYHAAGMGVNEQNSETEYVIYPNPTSGQFTVLMDNQRTINKMEISNVLGDIVFNIPYNIQQTRYEIDISDLPDGLYFLSIIEGDKKVTTKLLKQ